MKIFLTGADGFTGVHFTQGAVAAGHVVVPSAIDLKDKAALQQALAECRPEAVVHLAGIAFVSHEDTRGIYDVNLFGTLNLLDAVLAAGLRPRVLLASSANVYGNSPTSPIAESQAPAPVNHYAMSKLSMEFMAANYQDKLDLFITRPFNYTGPGQSPSFIVPKLVSHFARREPVVELGNMDVEREFNDVRFVSAAYLGLLDKAVRGKTYNICTGTTYTLRELLSMLGAITGHQIETRVNPAFVRANEIERLCGDPALLYSTVGQLPVPQLKSTLAWMIDNFTPETAHKP